MGFDGITLKGHSLKVRRPKDYKPVAEEKPTTSVGLPHIVSTNVQEGPNKIFIGGLPSYLNEEQVKELLSAFGQLKSFNLVKDNNTGNSKGFAFFEYLDADVTDKACAGLNGMKIGEKTVLVQRANIGAKQSQQQQQTTTNAPSCLTNPTALTFLNLGMPIAAATALLGLNPNAPPQPTTVVQLMNMINITEVMTEDDYEDLMEDIREECRNFGTITSIFIPRPPPSETGEVILSFNKPMWGVGRVFVEYKRAEDAQRAQLALGGRKFNGRSITSGFFSEERYARKDFSPDEYEERVCAEKFRLRQEEKERELQEFQGFQ